MKFEEKKKIKHFLNRADHYINKLKNNLQGTLKLTKEKKILL